MSINGLFRRVSADQFAQLRQDPSGVRALLGQPVRVLPKLPPERVAMLKQRLAQGMDDAQLARLPDSMRAQMKARLEGQLRQLGAQENGEQPAPAEARPVVSVEKMWQALHVIVAGVKIPGPGKAAFVLGGEECGPDVGYGPARLIPPQEVAEIARALPGPAELRKKFDPADLADANVYPNVWDEEPDDLWRELEGYCTPLLAMYREAAAAGDAVLAWIS